MLYGLKIRECNNRFYYWPTFRKRKVIQHISEGGKNMNDDDDEDEETVIDLDSFIDDIILT